ncbi:MAG: YqgE/AlgH family protein, partial [Planctomycetota bacterium]
QGDRDHQRPAPAAGGDVSFLSGKLLVASRKLRDPNFTQTVVLMLEHTGEGALGVVLNRLADRTVRQVWQSIDAEPCENDQDLNLGGPVRGPLIALHTAEPLADKAVLPGLFISMQREAVDRLVRQTDHPFRLYTGNAGWGGGQLEGELKAGGWHTSDTDAEDVFSDPADLWVRITRRIGLSIVLPGLDPDDAPDDPMVN